MINNNKKKTLARSFLLIGTLFFVSAASLILYNRGEEILAKQQAENVLTQLYAKSLGSEHNPPDYILNPNMEMPTIEIDGNFYIGSLQFSTLNIELPVMSSWSYSGLKISPCLYSGSIYQKNAVIAAHNYISHFGRLTELSQGDKITFTDVDNNIFIYEVIVQEVLVPTAIDDMLDNDADLSLFTCTLGGTSRFTVRCKLLETNSLQSMGHNIDHLL